MNNLFKIHEAFNNGINDNLLTLLSIASIICGIFVIISKNPIISILFLIGLFLTIASYLISIGMSFIGLSYLLVYVGAVSILFLFILMLINVRVSELITDNNNSVSLSIITITIFGTAFYNKIPLSSYWERDFFNIFFTQEYVSKINVNFVTSHTWDSTLAEVSHISSIGNILYTSYPMLLIITSIILLLAMVGAIVITIKQ